MTKFFLYLQENDGSTQWASADLGSQERKQKFLRLMGAGKVSFVCLCRSSQFGSAKRKKGLNSKKGYIVLCMHQCRNGWF